MLFRIYSRLANLYVRNESLGMICSCDLRFSLYENMLDLLRPWSTDLDSHSTGRINSMTKDQVNEISYQSSSIEIGIAIIYMHRSHFNIVETRFIVNEAFLMQDFMRGQKIRRLICYVKL
jgi:hypothetical protein